jgi:hypothetical protein
MTKGKTFFSDHKFFGQLYPAYEEAYDSVVERMIGLGYDVDLNRVTKEAGKDAGSYAVKDIDPEMFFTTLFNFERNICDCIKEYCPNMTVGTQNLLQGIADNSEVRQYQLRQRLA